MADSPVHVVTGGGSGIGAGVARELAASGARVVVLDRNFDAAKAVAAEVGGTARELDVTDEAAVDRGCGSNPRSLPTSSGPARRWPRWSRPGPAGQHDTVTE